MTFFHHRVPCPSNKVFAPSCTPLHCRTFFLDCEPSSGLPTSLVVRHPSHQLLSLFLLFSVVCPYASSPFLPRCICFWMYRLCIAFTHSLPTSFLGAPSSTPLRPPPASHSTGCRWLLAPNLRTHTGRAPPAIRTATLGFLPSFSRFRPPKAHLPFRGSLFSTRRRNRGAFLYGLRLSLPRVLLLLIRARAPTFTWQ